MSHHYSDYESDQSRLYNIHHHEDINSNESKSKVKNILKVTLWLSLITIVEVALGLFCHYNHVPKTIPNIAFIIMTVLKAWLIVVVFMHLGDEIKNMILTVIVPLVLFIWFIIAFLWEGSYWIWINNHFGIR